MKRKVDEKVSRLVATLNRVDNLNTRWSCSGHSNIFGFLTEQPYVTFHAPERVARAIASLIDNHPKLGNKWYVEVNFILYLRLSYTIRLNIKEGVSNRLLTKAVWQDLDMLSRLFQTNLKV